DSAQQDGRKIVFADYFPGNGRLRNNGAHEFTVDTADNLMLNGIRYFQRFPAPFLGFRLTASDLDYFHSQSATPFVFRVGVDGPWSLVTRRRAPRRYSGVRGGPRSERAAGSDGALGA